MLKLNLLSINQNLQKIDSMYEDKNMGKQLSFFMLPSDEKEFVDFVKLTGEVYIYFYRSKNKPFKSLKELVKPFSAPFWRRIYFYNKRRCNIL